MAIRKTNLKQNNDFNYEVIEKCGVLSSNDKSSMELRFVAWNGREPKYDIRPWIKDENGEKPGKGITLTGEELERLGEIIQEMKYED